jgi:S-formylglutathione hydrolase FrmB
MSVCRSTISAWVLAAAVSGATLFGAAGADASEILVDRPYESAALGRPAVYSVVRPEQAAGKLPVVYLLHGRDSSAAEWLRLGNVVQTLDRLIAEKRIPPLMLVLPDAGNGWYVDGPAMAAETAVARDLVADVERSFDVRRDREGRAIAGNSMGGFGAVRIALAYPERYVAAASMSGAFWTRIKPDTAIDDAMAARLGRVFSGAFGQPFDPKFFVARDPEQTARRLPPGVPHPALYLTASRGDRFRLAEEQDVMELRLKAAGLEVASAVTEGDHDWGTWAAAFPDVLEFLASKLKPQPQPRPQ